MLAARALRELGPAPNEREAKRNVNRALDQVAARLRNTRAVCRKYYVHPALIEAYQRGVLVPVPTPTRAERLRKSAALRHEEVLVLQFLQQQISTAQASTPARTTGPVPVPGVRPASLAS